MLQLKLTPAQQLIINGIISLLATAIVGAVSATYQYYDQNGLVNLGVLLNFMLLTFIVLFGKSLYDYVPGHAQQLIQALQDSEQQAQTALQQAFDHIEHLQQEPIALQTAAPAALSQGPLVVIHAAAMPSVQPPPVSQTQPSSAQTADQRATQPLQPGPDDHQAL
jgi:hypothetical protein